MTSTYATLAESYGAETVGVDSLGQTLELVLAGRADATLNADVSFYDYLKEHPDANLKIAALTEDAVVVSLPIRKGEDSASLLAAVNEALTELSVSGQLTALSDKYFRRDISQREVGQTD